jgi:hypothetical protein
MTYKQFFKNFQIFCVGSLMLDTDRVIENIKNNKMDAYDVLADLAVFEANKTICTDDIHTSHQDTKEFFQVQRHPYQQHQVLSQGQATKENACKKAGN